MSLSSSQFPDSPLPQISLTNLYEHILQSVHDGVHVVDLSGTVLLENESSAKMLGWCGDCLVGKNGHSAIHHHHADHREFAVADCPIYATIQDGLTRQVADDLFWRQDGSCFPVEYTVAPLRDSSGSLYGATVVFRDISEKKQAEARILRMAQYCPLTDLPNRTLFSDRLRQAIASAKRNQSRLGTLFIDLDKFKPVNDRYGHAVGDALLKQVASRMQHCVRESDTVARLGGDEFVVLLPDLVHAEQAVPVAEKIRAELSRQFQIDDQIICISSSIGVAIYPEHGVDEQALLQHADQAMYQAKTQGRNDVKMYRTG